MISTNYPTTLPWPAIILAASSSKETFEDVHVVTLISEYVDQVKAQLISSSGSLQYTNEQLRNAIDLHPINIQQYVTVHHGNIDVCVHAQFISDDTCFVVLTMVADALDQLSGVDGTIFFGDKMSFSSSDIPWLTIH